MTWTTLFGRVYVTRPHDDRDYVAEHLATLTEPGPAGGGGGGSGGGGAGGGGVEGSAVCGDRDYLTYLALAARHGDVGGLSADGGPGPGLAARLQHDSDLDGAEVCVPVAQGDPWLILPTLRLEHRRATGWIVPGPPAHLQPQRVPSTEKTDDPPTDGAAPHDPNDDPCPF